MSAAILAFSRATASRTCAEEEDDDDDYYDDEDGYSAGSHLRVKYNFFCIRFGLIRKDVSNFGIG